MPCHANKEQLGAAHKTAPRRFPSYHKQSAHTHITRVAAGGRHQLRRGAAVRRMAAGGGPHKGSERYPAAGAADAASRRAASLWDLISAWGLHAPCLVGVGALAVVLAWRRGRVLMKSLKLARYAWRSSRLPISTSSHVRVVIK